MLLNVNNFIGLGDNLGFANLMLRVLIVSVMKRFPQFDATKSTHIMRILVSLADDSLQ